MKTHSTALLLVVLAITVLSGCLTSISPLIGTWETKIIGFTQTIDFASNGTGVLVTTLGQQSFQFEIIDSQTLRFRYNESNEWEIESYQLVNTNTLEFKGLTWVRKGSV